MLFRVQCVFLLTAYLNLVTCQVLKSFMWPVAAMLDIALKSLKIPN